MPLSVDGPLLGSAARFTAALLCPSAGDASTNTSSIACFDCRGGRAARGTNGGRVKKGTHEYAEPPARAQFRRTVNLSGMTRPRQSIGLVSLVVREYDEALDF